MPAPTCTWGTSVQPQPIFIKTHTSLLSFFSFKPFGPVWRPAVLSPESLLCHLYIFSYLLAICVISSVSSQNHISGKCPSFLWESVHKTVEIKFVRIVIPIWLNIFTFFIILTFSRSNAILFNRQMGICVEKTYPSRIKVYMYIILDTDVMENTQLFLITSK